MENISGIDDVVRKVLAREDIDEKNITECGAIDPRYEHLTVEDIINS